MSGGPACACSEKREPVAAVLGANRPGRLWRVVDRYCTLPEGFTAGIDPAQDRKRFAVTDRGVTLITPELLGNAMHHLR